MHTLRRVGAGGWNNSAMFGISSNMHLTSRTLVKKGWRRRGGYTREESNGRYIYRVLTYDVDFPGLLQEQPRHVWIFRPAGDQFPVILHAWLELYHAHRPILPSLLLRAIHPRLLAVAAFERADNLISLLSRNYSSNILCKKEGRKERKEERRERWRTFVVSFHGIFLFHLFPRRA